MCFLHHGDDVHDRDDDHIHIRDHGHGDVHIRGHDHDGDHIHIHGHDHGGDDVHDDVHEHFPDVPFQPQSMPFLKHPYDYLLQESYHL